MRDETIFGKDFDQHEIRSRKELLPGYIKVYAYILLILGSPILLMNLYAAYRELRFTYDSVTGDRASLIGHVAGLLAFPGLMILASAPLLAEKKWAVNTALGALGIIMLCCVTALLTITSFSEITILIIPIALLPYCIKLSNIKKKWEAALPHK